MTLIELVHAGHPEKANEFMRMAWPDRVPDLNIYFSDWDHANLSVAEYVAQDNPVAFEDYHQGFWGIIERNPFGFDYKKFK